MNSDFIDAHNRHWKDAELLRSKKRLANADHLYGFSAECGLKALMVLFGMTLSPKGVPVDDKDIRHVDKLWPRYETYRSGRFAGTEYAFGNNVFSDWGTSQRYAHQSQFKTKRVEAHRQGAQTVRQLIAKAKREGLL